MEGLADGRSEITRGEIMWLLENFWYTQENFINAN